MVAFIIVRSSTSVREPLEALLERARETRSDEVAVSLNGVRETWVLGQAGGPIQTMSVTKSVVGLAIGRLVTLGHLASVDEPVHALFPEWRQGRKRGITVRMLLEHTSGLQNVPMTTEEIYPSDDFVQLALCAELDGEPGTTFAYNNKAFNLLAGVVERTSGRKLDVFTREELLAPLGIDEAPWMRDSAGNPHAMAGLALHAEDLVRLGELTLNRGAWRGTRLIDEAWFDAMAETGGVEETALGWWKVPLTRIEVSDRHLEALEVAGCDGDVVRTFGSLRGTHRSPIGFFAQLRWALGPDWKTRVPEGATPFDVETGETIGFRAEGDLGQYVYVLPNERLVVSRLVREETIAREAPEVGTPPASLEAHVRRVGPFLFADLEERVLALARAVAEGAEDGGRAGAAGTA